MQYPHFKPKDTLIWGDVLEYKTIDVPLPNSLNFWERWFMTPCPHATSLLYPWAFWLYFSFFLVVALPWKNFVFLSPSRSQLTLHYCLHINSYSFNSSVSSLISYVTESSWLPCDRICICLCSYSAFSFRPFTCIKVHLFSLCLNF